MNLDDLTFSKPIRCSKCGKANLTYRGVGEYECEECHSTEYDDYGKVRNYIETHRGATQAEVAQGTGVSTSKIRQLLREERIEVAANSNVFLTCEGCGIQIRSGFLCDACKRRMASRAASENRKINITGTAAVDKPDKDGARRFI